MLRKDKRGRPSGYMKEKTPVAAVASQRREASCPKFMPKENRRNEILKIKDKGKKIWKRKVQVCFASDNFMRTSSNHEGCLRQRTYFVRRPRYNIWAETNTYVKKNPSSSQRTTLGLSTKAIAGAFGWRTQAHLEKICQVILKTTELKRGLAASYNSL